MPGGELEPILPPPNLQGVPAEMSRIFTRAGATGAARSAAPPPRVSALRPEKGGGKGISWLAAAVAGVAGLGAGAFIIHTPAMSPVAPAPQKAAQPAAAPPAAVADAGPPLIIAPAPVETAAPAEPAPRVAAQRAARPKPKAVIVRQASVREPAAMAQPASCEKDATGPGCRRAVIQADHHLRDVYEEAVRRGVPRAVLVDYRDRWAGLREDSRDDPAHLIQGYGALAYDLRREARDDEEGASRRRSPSGLHALASALVPWW